MIQPAAHPSRASSSLHDWTTQVVQVGASVMKNIIIIIIIIKKSDDYWETA